MSFEIKLEYRRNDTTYAGTLISSNESALNYGFDGLSFAEMMRLVSVELVKHPDADVLFQRTDRIGLMPVRLAPDMSLLLRTDPEKYIQSHSLPDRTVDLRGSGRTSKLAEKYVVPKTGAIRSGHATLADAFGLVIYLKAQKGHIEHPHTGRWCTYPRVMEDLHLHELTTVPGTSAGDWVLVGIADLIKSNAERYYLPRAWNVDGLWITHEKLTAKYNQYMEKKTCLDQTKAH